MPIWVQWVSFALAIVGSISGVYALILNHQRTSITKRKEKERLEAKKKANFIVERTKQMGSRRLQDHFLLHNNGQAEARNVKVEFYNYDREGKRKKADPLGGDPVPSKINPQQTVNMLMILDAYNIPPFEIIITWDDDFKSGNKIETTLT